MLKSLFLFILCLFVIDAAFAQKRDTTVYYLNTAGKVVSTKDSADYFLVILPPDTSVDKSLFVVNEYYPNGRIKLITGSKTNNLDLKFQGSYIGYFPNGHKKNIGNYDNGEPVGDVVEYYPNGKLYNIKTYMQEKKLKYLECRDSIGAVLAENGNGKWVGFDGTFNKVDVEGQINNGLEEGEWHGRINDSVNFVYVYKEGHIVSSKSIEKSGVEHIFTQKEVLPKFKGGIDAFNKFLMHNIHYPYDAKVNNTRGRVIVTFAIDKDGTLNEAKVVRGIGDGCDEEALRVIKLSPAWIPGYQYGIPVRALFSIPIAFGMTQIRE